MRSHPSLGPKQLRLAAAAERNLESIARYLAEHAGVEDVMLFYD